MNASAISRVIIAEAGKNVRRRVSLIQAATGETNIFTGNAARHQAVALSRVRRVLIARGYEVTTFRGGTAGPFIGSYNFVLTVTGSASRKVRAA